MENTKDALRSLEAHLRQTPDDATAWNMKGVVHAQRSEFGEALRCLDQALQIDSALVAAHTNRGRVLLAISPEKATEALKSFNTALRLNPDDTDALRDKAQALRVLGRADEEIACYKRLSEQLPDEWGIWLRLGDSYLETGAIKSAIASYDTALQLKDDLVLAYIRRAIALGMEHEFDEALQSSKMATKLESENADAWLIHGDVNLRAGKLRSAMRALKKASELDPTNASVENTMGMVAYKDGNLEDAAKHLRRAIIRKRNYPTAIRNLGLILIELEEWEQASDVFNHLLEYVKNDPDVFDAQATVFARLEDFCSAQDAWEKARKLYKKKGNEKEAERVSAFGRAARINCHKIKKALKAQREYEKQTKRFSSRHEHRKKK